MARVRTALNPRVVVIGAGMSGILAAIKVREAGIEDVAVYEKADRLGAATFADALAAHRHAHRPGRARFDDLDRAVLADLPPNVFGAPPDGRWATARAGTLARLRHFVSENLAGFGPHQDAMTTSSWHLAHALLSPYLNLGLLHPREVCDAAEAAHRAGTARENRGTSAPRGIRPGGGGRGASPA